jgi:hypothetical protein
MLLTFPRPSSKKPLFMGSDRFKWLKIQKLDPNLDEKKGLEAFFGGEKAA